MDKPAVSPTISDVLLRDVTANDLPIFFDQQLDPEATRMAAFPARDREAFMTHWTKLLGDERLTKQTILWRGQVAGNIVSWDQCGEREVGYWLGRNYWGQGIATKALAEFLRQVVVRPLYAHVARYNVGSLRVLEKCGFAISGEEVEEFVLRLGANEKDAAQ